MSKEQSYHVSVELFKAQQQRTFKPGKSDIALDLGVGSGSSIVDLARNCHFVIGLDKDEDMLRTTHNKIIENDIKNALLVNGDVGRVDSLFMKKSFDFINCYAAFHHFYEKGVSFQKRFDKPKDILTKIHSVLKHDGAFVFFDPLMSAYTRDKWEKIIQEREEIHPEGNGQFYAKEEFGSLFNETGFKIVETRNYIFERHLNEWIKGAIKTDNLPESQKETRLKMQVINLFQTDLKVAEEFKASFREDTNDWVFYYPAIDIKAVKKA